jgi:septal ring factor EnvC (AmiA/AmiB activator)
MRVIIVVGLLLVTTPALAQDGFTQQDRDLLVELRVRLEEMDKRFEDFQASIDKRLEESQASMDRRFEQVDKRFEQVHTQIADLRQDMNRRFEQMFHFFYILAGIFTSMVVAVIGFAYWDRRTIIREARREAIEFMEKEGVLRRLLDAFRTLAEDDPRLATALKRFNLL